MKGKITNIDQIKDITGAEHLEIVISSDGKVVWINTDITCVFRACRVENLVIDDRRKQK